MPKKNRSAEFSGRIRIAAEEGSSKPLAFAKVPPDISRSHLRRGRMTAVVTIGKSQFEALMEPDGELGHWFEIPVAELENSNVEVGDDVTIALEVPATQPAPDLPPHFSKLLMANADALESWERTTTLARIDWVHWMESAKQEDTQLKRASDAIDMLSKGKKRVCCFDPSGVYSKALKAPQEIE